MKNYKKLFEQYFSEGIPMSYEWIIGQPFTVDIMMVKMCAGLKIWAFSCVAIKTQTNFKWNFFTDILG